MENCFRSKDIVIDYNVYTRRYTIKRVGSWVNVSECSMEIWFSMMKENGESFQRVSITQDRSQIQITKLFDNFHFEFTANNITNILSVTSETAKILLGNREKILVNSNGVAAKMEKLEKRIVQRSKQPIVNTSRKNKHNLEESNISIKRSKKAAFEHL